MPAKMRELREATTEELLEKVEELKSELFNLRFQKATGRLDNYKRLRQVRKDVARALTVIRERELGVEPMPSSPKPDARRRRLFRRRPVLEEEATEEEEPDEDEALEDADLEEASDSAEGAGDDEGEEDEVDGEDERAGDVDR